MWIETLKKQKGSTGQNLQNVNMTDIVSLLFIELMPFHDYFYQKVAIVEDERE